MGARQWVLALALVKAVPVRWSVTSGARSREGARGGRPADVLSAREGLDDEHRCSAVPAQERGACCCLRCGGGGRINGQRRRRPLQQRACRGDVVLAPGVSEQPVVADAMKASRQHVEQKPAHELWGGERHGLVARASLSPAVFPAERDAAFIHGHVASVGDGDAVGVARPGGRPSRAIPSINLTDCGSFRE